MINKNDSFVNVQGKLMPKSSTIQKPSKISSILSNVFSRNSSKKKNEESQQLKDSVSDVRRSHNQISISR
jgi:hypothetical protein